MNALRIKALERRVAVLESAVEMMGGDLYKAKAWPRCEHEDSIGLGEKLYSRCKRAEGHSGDHLFVWPQEEGE